MLNIADKAILNDYKQFRKVRAHVLPRICPGQWVKMTKREKSTLLRMVSLAEKAIDERKL